MATSTLNRTRDWETQFERWSQPPGATEQQRCENAVTSIKNAIQKSPKLSHRSIKVFPQGSYRNRVNVRRDSDVDVGILCSDSFMVDYPTGTTKEDFGNSDATYLWDAYKNEVEEALVNHFGRSAVTRGNKAFDIKENSYHVEADVVPLFEYRDYYRTDTGKGYRAGVSLRTDKERKRVINYPERLFDWWPDIPLHYENGVSKNTDTARRYKKIVRVIKSLRNEMNDNSVAAAEPIPGFLIECLVWNTPNDKFGSNTWTQIVRNVLFYLWENTKTDETCKKWTEVNDIKYLFHSTQPWNRAQVNMFLMAAWKYLGLPTN